eukprot:Colp12_sorted_trinity150504_noHs@15614
MGHSQRVTFREHLEDVTEGDFEAEDRALGVVQDDYEDHTLHSTILKRYNAELDAFDLINNSTNVPYLYVAKPKGQKRATSAPSHRAGQGKLSLHGSAAVAKSRPQSAHTSKKAAPSHVKHRPASAKGSRPEISTNPNEWFDPQQDKSTQMQQTKMPRRPQSAMARLHHTSNDASVHMPMRSPSPPRSKTPEPVDVDELLEANKSRPPVRPHNADQSVMDADQKEAEYHALRLALNASRDDSTPRSLDFTVVGTSAYHAGASGWRLAVHDGQIARQLGDDMEELRDSHDRQLSAINFKRKQEEQAYRRQLSEQRDHYERQLHELRCAVQALRLDRGLRTTDKKVAPLSPRSQASAAAHKTEAPKKKGGKLTP